MKLQGRNLILGMQGNDVRELQRDLARLGFDILSQEVTGGRFGETTRTAVQLLHGQNGGRSDGVVDIKTVDAINDKLGDLSRVVRGNLRRADGKPLARKGRGFNNLAHGNTSGRSRSDADGYFEISYMFRYRQGSSQPCCEGVRERKKHQAGRGLCGDVRCQSGSHRRPGGGGNGIPGTF